MPHKALRFFVWKCCNRQKEGKAKNRSKKQAALRPKGTFVGEKCNARRSSWNNGEKAPNLSIESFGPSGENREALAAQGLNPSGTALRGRLPKNSPPGCFVNGNHPAEFDSRNSS